MALQADLSDLAAAAALPGRAAAALGGLDILVSNAGALLRKPLAETTDAEFARIHAINLGAGFALAREAAALMGAGGRIVFTSSVNQWMPNPGLVAYGSSKAGLGGLARQLALELAPAGITVNAVAPGTIETDLNRAAREDPAWRERKLALIPARPHRPAGGRGRRDPVPLQRLRRLRHGHDADGGWRAFADGAARMTWEVHALRYAVDAGRRASQWFLGGSGGDAPMPIAYHAFLLRGPDGVVGDGHRGGCGALRALRQGGFPVARGRARGARRRAAGGADRHPDASALGPCRAARASSPTRPSTCRRGRWRMSPAPPCAMPCCARATRPQTSPPRRTLLHAGRPRPAPGRGAAGRGPDRCTMSAATRTGCRWCACGRGAAGCAWPPMPSRIAPTSSGAIPFPAVFHVGDALDAFDTVLALADAPELVIPGHDPWVTEAHPPSATGTAGWLARLD